MHKSIVLRSCFADLAALELLCDRMVMQGEVRTAMVFSATDEAALQGAKRAGFALPQSDLTKLDLVACAHAADEEKVSAALAKIRSAAALRPERDTGGRFTNPAFALAACPEADLAAVGVRSEYAAAVAEQCLASGVGVLMQSDIPFEQEQALRRIAKQKQLPFFGSGAAGAMLCHRALGICPQLPEGSAAVVAGSFTAALTLAFLLQRGGAGVRHLLPVGRRDCFAQCGGSTTSLCLDALAADSGTEAVALVYKAGDFELMGQLTEQAKALGKPLYLYGTGQLKSGAYAETLGFEPTLAKLAHRMSRDMGGEGLTFLNDAQAAALAAPYKRKLQPQQKYLRGFFLSDTMCGEIAAPLLESLEAVYSNRPVRAIHLQKDLQFVKGHTVIDYGDSALTPTCRSAMQAQLGRNRRIITESHNASAALILTDWYGAEGCDEQYLRHLCRCIHQAIDTAKQQGRTLAVGCVVHSGSGSPVDIATTEQLLRGAGAEVFFSADDAALFAKHLLCAEEQI